MIGTVQQLKLFLLLRVWKEKTRALSVKLLAYRYQRCNGEKTMQKLSQEVEFQSPVLVSSMFREEFEGNYVLMNRVTSNCLIVSGGYTSSSMLQIRPSRLTDDGEFVCVAKNIAGKDTSATLLDIQKRPTIDPNQFSKNLTPSRGSQLSIPCVAYGDPTPTIRCCDCSGIDCCSIISTEIPTNFLLPS